MHSTYQTADTAFAAAAIALGCLWDYTVQQHLAPGSQTHNKTFATWMLKTNGALQPDALASKLKTGELAKKNPAHPVFACLAGIECYRALSNPAPSAPLSLVPFLPAAFQSSLLRACVLRPSRVGDGNLLDLAAPRLQPVPLDLRYAAVMASAGVPLVPHPGPMVPVFPTSSLAFPSLDARTIADAIAHMEDQTEAAARGSVKALENDARRTTQLTHQSPGFPPGDHPVHYAHAAVSIYAALLGGSRKPRTFFLRQAFAALIPVDADPASQFLTERFLAEGGSVFV